MVRSPLINVAVLWLATSLLATATAFAALPPSGASSPDRSRLNQRIAQSESCFFRKLDLYRSEGADGAARASSVTRIYLAEQVARHVTYNAQKRTFEGPLLELDPEDFCDRFLWQPYRGALKKALAEERQELKGGLAPLGSVPIETRSSFVGLYQNMIGKHYAGHADLTLAALGELATSVHFSGDASLLLQRASQAPDLFRWNDERYHAHTPDFEVGDTAADRGRKIGIGQQRYRRLLIGLFQEFQRYANAGTGDRALFVLGLISHAVQDLVYHRGMTLRQHAGLAYAVKRNPDFPPEPIAAARQREAVANTKRALEEARSLVSESVWIRVIQWRNPGDFDFPRLAREVFAGEEDIGLAPLMEYWALSLPYSTGERNLAELEETACGEPQGLACWNTQDVLKSVFPIQPWITQLVR